MHGLHRQSQYPVPLPTTNHRSPSGHATEGFAFSLGNEHAMLLCTLMPTPLGAAKRPAPHPLCSQWALACESM